tara:strand:+ start:523 stop:1233 length:711 start_codon:yes stop_codon:yes gene_type:complete
MNSVSELFATLVARYPSFAPVADFYVIGGPVVWVLSVFSVVAVMIALLKLWQLLRSRESDAVLKEAIDLLQQGKAAEAQARLQTMRGPRAVLLGHTIRLLRQGALTADEVGAEVTRIARSTLAPFESGLRTLEVIATLSPLLGLLGTVMGMIAAFQAMQAAGSQVNPAVLSGGIWQALLTTAVGLAVAIPVSLLHSWFERRHEVRATQVADTVQHAMTTYAEVRAQAGRPAERLAA